MNTILKKIQRWIQFLKKIKWIQFLKNAKMNTIIKNIKINTIYSKKCSPNKLTHCGQQICIICKYKKIKLYKFVIL